MKQVLLLALCIAFIQNTFAQPASGSIYGSVTDSSTHQPIPYATVTLLNAADSALTKGAISDSAGNFLFENISPGEYILSASALSRIKKFSGTLSLGSGEAANAGTLALSKGTNTLKGVTVTSSKPLFEQKPGMLVVNVGSSITAAGNSAMDILRKSPGVNIDNDGNISLKGKQGVRVMMDDKPTYLSAEQLSTLLKAMPSANIQQIEIMSNPPAKYDAEGTAGIINIRMKKNTGYGFSGMLNGTFKQWDYSSGNAGLTMNYKNKLMNVFGNYTFNNYHYFIHSDLTRHFYRNDSLATALTQNRLMLMPGQQHSFKGGADFYISKNQTLGFFVNGLLNAEDHAVTNDADILNPAQELLSSSNSDIRYKNQFNNLTYDLNYKAALDSAGTTFSFDADYSEYHTSSKENYLTNYFDGNGTASVTPTIWSGEQPSVITIQSSKADFVLPFKHQIKLEAGAKSSLVNSDNDMNFRNYISGNWVTDEGITNHFIYRENINAAYADVTKELGKGWGAQLGLRGEQTIVSGKQIVNDSSFTRNYFQLFPTVFVKKDYGKQNQFSFSYSRRVQRPNYMDLNPFRFYVDPYTYRMGSPYLGPQITDALNLTHVYKNFLTTSLDVSRASDVFADVLQQVDSLNLTIQYKKNLNTLDNISLTVSAPVTIAKWWQSTNSVSAYYNRTTGFYLGEELNNWLTTVEANSQNVFVLPKNFTLELSGYYRSPMAFSIFQLASTADVSAGIKKTFWNRRASLKLSASDIFNTTHSHVIIRYSDIDIVVEHRWDSRIASVSFTYIFGNTKVRGERHNNGIEEEQGRVKKSVG